jgi:PAS domain S-box-containing protein
LGIVSESLQIATEELDRQGKRFAILQTELEVEQQRYRDLFELARDGFLITDSDLVVQEVNHAGLSLMNLKIQSVVGQSLTTLVHPADLALFQARLANLGQQERAEFSVRLSRYPTGFFYASVAVQVTSKPEGGIQLLQWLVRDVTERRRAEVAFENPDYTPCTDRPVFHFTKGETIPSERQAVWMVCEGVVKLTTLSGRGEETLVGLVGNSMVFGNSLTSLPTYQAIALSDVKLALIPISEIATSPQLAQALLSSLKERLQQTESLLAIYGQIRVEERLNSLLTLLKQAIGQPVEQGVRLRARLTHQDFASACCTTRVTVTRLLGKLQEQGKIIQDAHNHLVLKE